MITLVEVAMLSPLIETMYIPGISEDTSSVAFPADRSTDDLSTSAPARLDTATDAFSQSLAMMWSTPSETGLE